MHASLSACTWPKPNPTVTRSRHCQPSQPAAGGLAGRLGCDQSREATMASSHAPAVSQPHLMERPDAKCPNPSRMPAGSGSRTATARHGDGMARVRNVRAHADPYPPVRKPLQHDVLTRAVQPDRSVSRWLLFLSYADRIAAIISRPGNNQLLGPG
jgi:hypothetical protein